MRKQWLIAASLFTFLLAGCGKEYPPTSGGRTGASWAEALQGQDVELRRKAATKLGPLILTDKDALPALITALRDADAEVRRRAVWSLGTYSGATKGPEVLPELREIQQKDTDAKVRETAAEAISKLANAAGS